MLNVPRPLCVRTLLLCLLVVMAAPTIKAQEAQYPGLDRQLARIDLSVTGVGELNKDSNGTATVGGVPNTPVNLHPGNTFGALVSLRYIKSPLLGFEFNYGYARYTQTFTPFGNSPTGPTSGGVQQNTSEYTVGYVAHIRPVFGLSPYASGGVGTIVFRPTPGGGEGLLNQARMAYYYSVGAEKTVFSPHFGVRAQFRQVFFKAPDFETNYLTIGKRTSTLEPGVGFFIHF